MDLDKIDNEIALNKIVNKIEEAHRRITRESIGTPQVIWVDVKQVKEAMGDSYHSEWHKHPDVKGFGNDIYRVKI